MNTPWRDQVHTDGVDVLHRLGVPETPERTLRWCVPERSALVLGSAQLQSDVDERTANDLDVEIVRRASGGGAVLVEPGDIVWLDVLIPSHDPLWRADVGKAFWWLGDVLAGALAEVAGLDASVHRGALVTTPWSRMVCFAGRGPGEVMVGERKVAGISQRRVRAGALFQCAIARHFRISRLSGLLAITPREREDLEAWLAGSVLELPDLSLEDLRAALHRRLPE